MVFMAFEARDRKKRADNLEEKSPAQAKDSTGPEYCQLKRCIACSGGITALWSGVEVWNLVTVYLRVAMLVSRPLRSACECRIIASTEHLHLYCEVILPSVKAT